MIFDLLARLLALIFKPKQKPVPPAPVPSPPKTVPVPSAPDTLTTSNGVRWVRMKVKPELAVSINAVACRLTSPSAKGRYVTVSEATKVPWFIIAVIHEREASQNWHSSLAQGDPWDQVSTHVPKGRGPFRSWEEAAMDALANCPPYAARWRDWTAGGALTLLEHYNGLGYAHKGLPSPYVWAGTDQYVKGKYVADGQFDPNAIDHQLGCAAIIQRMMDLDNSIKFAA